MALGVVAALLFTLVDTFFVGQLGTRELAAMTFTFPVTFTLMSVFMGLGVGSASVIARALGQGDFEQMRRLATDAIVLSALSCILLSSLGYIFMSPIFRLMGAEADLIPRVEEYMRIWFPGTVLLAIPMMANSSIRGTGDTLTPGIVMSVAGVVNIILDPLLIFGLGPFPRLELEGAAIASVISWVFAMIAALWITGKREKLLVLPIFSPRLSLESWKKILYIGLPAASTNVLAPLSVAVLTGMTARYGSMTVAAFGVAGRLEAFSMTGIMALSAAVAPMIGVNFGARNFERIREILGVGRRFALLWGLGVAVLFFLLAEPLARAFDKDPRVNEVTVLYLRMVPLSYAFFALSQLITSCLNALHRPLHSAGLNLLRLFLLMLPLALLFSQYMNVAGIFLGMALANVLTGVLSAFLLAGTLRYMDVS